MLASAPHRGTAVETAAEGGCALGVSDDPRGGGASVSSSAGWAAAFAGVLDNGDELRAALERGGAPVGDTSPAGLALAAIRAAGEAAPASLRGKFAALVTDGSRVWAFRDHVGFQPLFFRIDGESAVVASEAKQVVVGAGLRHEPDVGVLEEIFYDRYDDATPSALQGVRRLPKATTLVAGPEGVRTHRYWEPEHLLETARLTQAELAERFDELMTQAVARCFRGDDVLSLSGGIDSNVVLGYGASAYQARFGRPLPALTALYPEQPAVDERTWVELAARRAEVPLHTFVHTAGQLDRLAELTRLYDGPTPAWLANEADEQYRRAGALGFGTMLTGEVAELVVDISFDLLPHYLLRGHAGALVRLLRAQRRRGASGISLARGIVDSLVPAPVQRARRRRRARFRGLAIPTWLDWRRVERAPASLSVPARERWRYHQLAAFRGPGLTLEADQIRQDVNGVQVRMPFADVDLWEFFLSLPAEQKFPDDRTKTLLRTLARGKVPDVILDRRRQSAFNDSFLAGLDYAELGRWLADPTWRMPGVDYRVLAERLEAGRFDLAEYVWARDLAVAHAFVASLER